MNSAAFVNPFKTVNILSNYHFTMPPRLSSQTVLADLKRVTHLRVVVHTLGAAGLNTSDNHWSIYLIHDDGASSTRINMRAEFEDPTGFLDWTQQGYIQTTSAIVYWDFPVAAGTTVSSVARIIYDLRRDRYMMSGGGSGCRWWV